MSHKVEPGRACRIITIEIAVPYEAQIDGAIADEISAMLTEHGTCSEESCVLDWRYAPSPINEPVVAIAPSPVEEGEIFHVERMRPCLRAKK